MVVLVSVIALIGVYSADSPGANAEPTQYIIFDGDTGYYIDDQEVRTDFESLNDAVASKTITADIKIIGETTVSKSLTLNNRNMIVADGGVLTTTASFTVSSGRTLTVDEGGEVICKVAMSDSGTIVNNGTFSVYNNVNGSGKFEGNPIVVLPIFDIGATTSYSSGSGKTTHNATSDASVYNSGSKVTMVLTATSVPAEGLGGWDDFGTMEITAITFSDNSDLVYIPSFLIGKATVLGTPYYSFYKVTSISQSVIDAINEKGLKVVLPVALRDVEFGESVTKVTEGFYTDTRGNIVHYSVDETSTAYYNGYGGYGMTAYEADRPEIRFCEQGTVTSVEFAEGQTTYDTKMVNWAKCDMVSCDGWVNGAWADMIGVVLTYGVTFDAEGVEIDTESLRVGTNAKVIVEGNVLYVNGYTVTATPATEAETAVWSVKTGDLISKDNTVITATGGYEYTIILGNSVKGQDSSFNGLYKVNATTPVKALYEILTEYGIQTTITGEEESIYFKTGMISDWTTSWDSSAADDIGPNYGIWAYTAEDGWFLAPNSFGMDPYTTYIIAHTNYYKVDGATAKAAGITKTEEGTYTGPVGWDYSNTQWGYVQAAPVGLKSAPEDVIMGNELYLVTIPEESIDNAKTIAEMIVETYVDPIGFTWTVNEGATEAKATITETYTNSSGKESTRTLTFEKVDNVKEKFVSIGNALLAEIGDSSSMGTWKLFGYDDEGVAFLVIWQNRDDRDYSMVKYVMAAGDTISYGGEDGSASIYFRNTGLNTTLPMIIVDFFMTMADAFTTEYSEYTIILNNSVDGEDSTINGLYTTYAATPVGALYTILKKAGIDTTITGEEESIYFKSGMISDWTSSWDSSAADLIGANFGIWAYTSEEGWFLAPNAFGKDDFTTYIISHTNYYKPDGETAVTGGIIKKQDGSYEGPAGWDLTNSGWGEYAYVQIAPRDLDAAPEDVVMGPGQTNEYTIILNNSVDGEDSSFNGLYVAYAENPVKALYNILVSYGIDTTITGEEESIYFKSGMISDWTTGWDSSATDLIGANYGVWAYTSEEGWFLAPNSFGADDFTTYIISHTNYYKPDGATAKAAGITKNEEGAYTGPVGWDYSNTGWGDYSYVQAAPVGLKSAPEDVIMGNELYLVTIPEEGIDNAATIAEVLAAVYIDPIGFTWTVDEGATEAKATITETYTNSSGKESTRLLTFEKVDNVKEKFVTIGNTLLADVGTGNSMGTWKVFDYDDGEVAYLVIWQNRDDRDYSMVKYVMAAGNIIAYGGEDGSAAIYFRNTGLDTTLPMIIDEFFATMADTFTTEFTKYTFILNNSVDGEDSTINGIYTGYGVSPVAALCNVLDANGIPYKGFTADDESVYFKDKCISDWSSSWHADGIFMGNQFAIWNYNAEDGWFLGNEFGTDDDTVYLISHESYLFVDGPLATAVGVYNAEAWDDPTDYGLVYDGVTGGFLNATVALSTWFWNTYGMESVEEYGISLIDGTEYDDADEAALMWSASFDPKTYTAGPGISLNVAAYGAAQKAPYDLKAVPEKMVFGPSVAYITLDLKGGDSSSVNYAHGWMFDDDDGTWSMPYAIDSKFPVIENPVLLGANFIGWTPELPSTVTESAEYAATYEYEYTIILNNSVEGEDSSINGLYTVYATTPVKALYKILTEKGIPTTITGDEKSIYFTSGMISNWTTSWDSSATDLIGANYGVWVYTEDDGWFLAPNSFGVDDYRTYIISHTNYYKPDGATAKAAGITKTEEGTYSGPVGWDYSNSGWGDYAYVQAAPIGLRSAPEDIVMGNQLYLFTIPEKCADNAGAIATALVDNYNDPIGFVWTVNDGSTEAMAAVTETYSNSKGEVSTRLLTFEKVDNVKEKFVAIGNVLLAEVGKNSSMGTWKVFDYDDEGVAYLVIWQNREDRDYTMVKYVMAAGSTIAYGGEDGTGAVYFRNTAIDTTLPMIITEFFSTMADAFTTEYNGYTIILDNSVDGEDSSFNGLYVAYETTPVKALYRILTENGIPTTITGDEASIYFKSGMIADWTTSWDSSATDLIGANYGVWAYTSEEGWFLAPNSFGADDFTTYIISHTNYYKPDGATAKAAGITKNEEGAYTGPVGWDYSNTGWGDYSYVQAAPVGLKSAPEDAVMGNPLYLVTISEEGVDNAATITGAFVKLYDDPIGFTWTVDEGATEAKATITETYTNSSGKESTRLLTFEKVDNVKEKFVTIGNTLLADVGTGNSMGTWKLFAYDDEGVAYLVIWQYREDRDYCMVKYVMAAGDTISYGGEDGTGAVYFRNTDLDTTLPMIIVEFFSTMADTFTNEYSDYTIILSNTVEGEDSTINGLYTAYASSPVKALYEILTENGIPTTITGDEASIYFKSGMISDWTTSWDSSAADLIGANYGIWAYTSEEGWFMGNTFGTDDFTTYIISHTNYYKPDGATAKAAGITKNEEGAYTGPVGWDYSNSGWGEYAYVQAAPVGLKSAPEDVVMGNPLFLVVIPEEGADNAAAIAYALAENYTDPIGFTWTVNEGATVGFATITETYTSSSGKESTRLLTFEKVDNVKEKFVAIGNALLVDVGVSNSMGTWKIFYADVDDVAVLVIWQHGEGKDYSMVKYVMAAGDTISYGGEDGTASIYFRNTNLDTTLPMIITGFFSTMADAFTAEVVEYTITYMLDGQAYGEVEKAVAGTIITVRDKAVKEGYTVSDWASDDVTFEDGKFLMPGKNVTISATSEPNKHTVTYKLDGETYGNVDTVAYGTVVTVRDKAVKEGYTVSDWASEVVVITDGKFTMPDYDVEIYALSKINQYTITFDTEGGTAVQSITADYGAAIVAPQNPTKLGCDFSNWYPAIPKTMPAQDMTIKAVWTQTDKDGNTNVDLTESGSDEFVMPETASKSADIKVNVGETETKQTADVKVENASELSGKTVNVSVDKTEVPPEVKEKNAVAYEFDFKANGVQYNGKMQVTLPYTKESGKDPVVYWANGSSMEKMNIISSTDGSVTFETDHNSVYVVASAEPASGGSDNTALIIVGVVIAIVVIAAVAFFVMRSRQ